VAAKKLTMPKPKHPEVCRVDVDRHVSRRIRERRILLGMTQQDLANRIGLTYQQVHKYETGINRISAGILSRIAKALRVEVGYFYQGLGEPDELAGRPRAILSLMQDFTNLTNPRQRQALLRLSRALADVDLGNNDDVEPNDG